MNKQEQKNLIVEIMNEDQKDGLYKQTAVEYLYSLLPTIVQKDLAYKFEQAKQIEKEQIKDAWDDGHDNGLDYKAKWQQYYEHNYGGNNEQQ